MARLRRLAIRTLLAIVAAMLVVWTVDYARLQLMSPSVRFGSIVVQKYYAVALKNKKTEFMFDDPGPETCVHSLLPHYGDVPCWYLEKHTRQRIDVGSTPSDFWRLP